MLLVFIDTSNLILVNAKKILFGRSPPSAILKNQQNRSEFALLEKTFPKTKISIRQIRIFCSRSYFVYGVTTKNN